MVVTSVTWDVELRGTRSKLIKRVKENSIVKGNLVRLDADPNYFGSRIDP